MLRSGAQPPRRLDLRFQRFSPVASAPKANAGASATGAVSYRSVLGTGGGMCGGTSPLSAPGPPLAKPCLNAILSIAEAVPIHRQRRFGWGRGDTAPGRPRDAE